MPVLASSTALTQYCASMDGESDRDGKRGDEAFRSDYLIA